MSSLATPMEQLVQFLWGVLAIQLRIECKIKIRHKGKTIKLHVLLTVFPYCIIQYEYL